MATSRAHFVVRFDPRAWAEDVGDRYAERSGARRVAERARREFERHGVAAGALQACDHSARDGTRLGNCVKAYLPVSERPSEERPFGMVFAPVLRERELQLDFLAFGVRHQPADSRAPSVYEIAHARLHGRWP